MDDAEPLGVLHNLYLMTFNQLGRDAVVRVFTMAEHLQALLPFMEFTGALYECALVLFEAKLLYNKTAQSTDCLSSQTIMLFVVHAYSHNTIFTNRRLRN